MADDLRSTLQAAMASAEKQPDASAPVASPAPSPAPAPAADAPAAPYGEDKGSTDNSGVPPSTDSPKIGENPVDSTKETPNAQESSTEDRTSRAPQSWKAGPKQKWAALDPEIRSEVVRRERETTRALADSASARKFHEGFQEALTPYQARLQGAGVEPLVAVKHLLEVDRVMASSDMATKAQFAAKWLSNYGVDINALDLALAGKDVASASPEARIEQLLQQKLAPVTQFMTQQQQAAQNAARADQERAVAEVQSMQGDEANFPDFDLVREEMADIIEINSRRGVYLTPKQAYTKAVAMNPDASAAVAQRSKQTQAVRTNETANRALGASLSVSGNPSMVRTSVPASDLRGTIEAAAAALAGR